MVQKFSSRSFNSLKIIRYNKSNVIFMKEELKTLKIVFSFQKGKSMVLASIYKCFDRLFEESEMSNFSFHFRPPTRHTTRASLVNLFTPANFITRLSLPRIIRQ